MINLNFPNDGILTPDLVSLSNSPFLPLSKQKGEKKIKNKISVNSFSHQPVFALEDEELNVDNQRGKIFSRLEITQRPYLQAIKIADSYPVEHSSLSSYLSFANWTLEKKDEAIKTLEQLQIPLQPEFIRKIYSLLQLYEKALCQNADISYPARFKVKAIYQPCSEQTSFDLEIHTNRKASLIFQETKKTWIETGTTKIVLGAYTLGKPKKIAYLMSRSQSHTKDNANNEEKYFTLLKGEPYIAKVYGIFYYPFSGTYRKDPQQIIEMKYYSRDLFKLLRSPDYSKLSDQKKINYSRQLIEAIDQLHQKKILHRDIKLENILVSDQKGLKITDFGLACQQDDPNLSTQRVGSMSSVSPEIIRDEIDPNPDGQARDIWSAGCVLWLLWYPNSLYPWYEEIGELYPDSEIILHAMRNFDSCKIDPSQKLPFLIWNMLRYEAHLRWKPTQILEALKSIADHLSANSSTSNLTEQFPMPK